MCGHFRLASPWQDYIFRELNNRETLVLQYFTTKRISMRAVKVTFMVCYPGGSGMALVRRDSHWPLELVHVK